MVGSAENDELATRWLSPAGPATFSRALARSLPEPVPAYRTADADAMCRADGAREVVLVTPRRPDDLTGSPHSGGAAAMGGYRVAAILMNSLNISPWPTEDRGTLGY